MLRHLHPNVITIFQPTVWLTACGDFHWASLPHIVTGAPAFVSATNIFASAKLSQMGVIIYEGSLIHLSKLDAQLGVLLCLERQTSANLGLEKKTLQRNKMSAQTS